MQGSITRPLAVVAMVLFLAAPDRAPASREGAVAAVRNVIGAHAHACRISVDRLYVTRLGDPLDLGHTLAYRVDARIDRESGAAFAAWEVRRGAPTPVSPLAGEIERGCSLRDPGAPTSADAWRSLPYLDYDSGALDVTTSPAWHGAVARKPSARPRSPWAQAVQSISAPRCSTRLAVTRTLYLPGRPAEAAIHASVPSFELVVNGRVAARRSGRLHALGPFRDGANRVELLAPCGVAAELTGVFRADAAVFPTSRVRVANAARIGDQFYRRANGPVSGTLDFTVVNHGPSAIPSATFVVHVGVGARVAMVIQGRHCRRRDATSRLAPPYGTLCTLGHIRPGQRVQFHAVYEYRPRHIPFEDEDTYVTYEVRDSPWDANPWNQQRTVTLNFCGTEATSAGCARAP